MSQKLFDFISTTLKEIHTINFYPLMMCKSLQELYTPIEPLNFMCYNELI